MRDIGLPERWAPPLLSLLRIVTGLLFFEHGTQKLLGFPPPQMPIQGNLMMVAGVLELVGGALILVGLFTRPVAFILSGQMAVAYWMSLATRGPFPVLNMRDAAILFCFVFLYLAAAGPGAWSVDRARGRGRMESVDRTR